MKKVLHVVEATGGGIFTYLVELANGMCDQFEITIAYGVRSETPENIEDYFDSRVKLIQVPIFTRGLNPFKDFAAGIKLRKIAKEVKPDIVHMHSSKAGAVGRLALGKKNRKFFYTPHGYSFLMEHTSKLSRNIFKILEKICGKINCLTVACGESEWEASKAVTKKSTYISNGVNIEKLQEKIDEYNKLPHSDKADKFTVYTVGRINNQKNPELFNEIAKAMPEIDFVWIGDGELRDLIDAENVRITGWLDNMKAMSEAQKYDVFLLASRYEGLPISLLEAMYLKKICVVSNVVGNKDVIKKNKTGYLCESVDQFVNVINEIKDRGADENLVKNAYDSILNEFNSGCLVEKYKELYLQEKS